MTDERTGPGVYYNTKVGVGENIYFLFTIYTTTIYC